MRVFEPEWSPSDLEFSLFQKSNKTKRTKRRRKNLQVTQKRKFFSNSSNQGRKWQNRKCQEMSRLGHGGVNLGFSKKAFLGFLESFLFLFFLLHFHVGDPWWRTISLKVRVFLIMFPFHGVDSLLHCFFRRREKKEQSA